MPNHSGVGVAVLVAVALLAPACGISGGVAEVTLAELTTDQDGFHEQMVRTEGIVRAFDNPRHFWIEDADLNRVELQPPGAVESHLGERIRVEGRFTFRDDEGRRIAVEDVEVLDAAPEAEEIAATGGSYTRAAPGARPRTNRGPSGKST